eukprot:CAMPEP_0178983478 /NCGR_PEP_ID=MMETSP0795-20121207/1079_1 /TAXON_ID=88552 /ORGANISM="Amoebophrya sp., Strain Ameob2" /LENGTH=476 /DNA_ID=CAMNT_0020674249 /DNA_START=103 /DNA_END=1534 /DNA_ORIENTATION=-
MIVKCNKTGKILFSTEEAQKHAEQIGSQDFTEVAADQKLLVDAETKRRCFWSEDEVRRFRERTRQPDFAVLELTIQEYRNVLNEHEKKFLNDAKIINYAKKKIVDALVEVKGYGVVRSEKACWFTGNKGVSEAEAWIASNKDDPEIDKPLQLPADVTTNPNGESIPMEVDQEGGASSSAVVTTLPTDPDATENGAWLTAKCNESLVTSLGEMGFARIRSEKACYFTDSVSLEHAIQWLTDHEKDADHAAPTEPAKPKMSKEEAERAALELQARLKSEREAREKQEAKDKERARIESAKMALESDAILKEEQRKRDIEQLKREKLEHEAHAAELKERLRLDYIDRFGHEPPPEENQAKDDIKAKPSKQQLTFWIQSLRKEYATSRAAELKVCLNTIKLFAKNCHENPDEKKYQVLKKSGKAFSDRIAPLAPESLELLRVLGFKDDDGASDVMEIKNQVDGFLMSECIKFVDLVLQKI